jgi:tRNA pseudouridine32 synthase/23S rRNA pseudouridine746 synthase
MPLPTRDGVGPSCIALPAGPWLRVIDFLTQRFPGVSPDEIAARMARGDVVDELGDRVLPDRPYTAQLRLYYYRSIELEPRIPFDEVLLFQDDYLLAVDKPHFLPVTPGGRYLQETLLVRLKRKLGIDTIAPMHRIDRETAGVVLFTLQPSTRRQYHALFEQKAVHKCYQAIAPWRADLDLPLTRRSRLVEGDSFMRMCEAAGEPNAETTVELVEVMGKLARYRLTPLSGKKHQLRVHMAALGLPILNDKIYPEHHSIEQIENGDYSKPLQLLAERIAFVDPISGQRREFASRQSLDGQQFVNNPTGEAV